MCGVLPEDGRNGGGEARPTPSQYVPGRSTILASELGGNLPCLRCKYNLRGLSIRAVCPECAMPVRATLLAVVDPMASELRAIPRPRAIATGIVLWSTGALLAALCVWAREILEGHATTTLLRQSLEGLGLAIVALTAASGVGAASLIRPHDGIRPRRRLAALIATLSYAPLTAVMWLMYRPGSGSDARELPALWILAHLLMIVVILGLRPNARLLAARSLLMRTGRVDRQTLLALVGVLGLTIAGEAGMLVSRIDSLDAGTSQSIHLVAQTIVMVASALFTIGLAGVAVDCWRIRPVVLESPRTLEGILGTEAPVAATAPAVQPRPQATS
jgi:hypothetical protein